MLGIMAWNCSTADWEKANESGIPYNANVYRDEDEDDTDAWSVNTLDACSNTMGGATTGLEYHLISCRERYVVDIISNPISVSGGRF